MAEYKSSNIVNSVDDEIFFKIKNKQNVVRFTVYCDTVSVIYSSKTYVVIKTKSDNNVIKLDFDTATEAQQALVKINEAKDKAERNCESQDLITDNSITYCRSNGNLLNNQNIFTLSNATTIKSVHINGMNIENYYTFDTDTKVLTIRISDLGWSINTSNDEDDIIIVKYN